MVRLRSSLLLRKYLGTSLRSCKSGVMSSYVAAAEESSATDFVRTSVSSLGFNDIAWVGGRIGLSTVTHKGASFSTSAFPQDSQRDAESAAESRESVDDAGEESEHVFDDPRISILDAALDHVEAHGFSETALAAGAKDRGFHSVATGMFPKGAADLIYHARGKALQEVKNLSVQSTASGDEASEEAIGREGMPSSGKDEGAPEGKRAVEPESAMEEVDKLRQGIEAAVLSIARYKTHWAHAMAIGALPQNAGTTATTLAILADELAFLGGDRSTDLVWYGKRGFIAGIYASTELHMLTDDSDGFADTWAYLDRRLLDYETLVASPQNMGDVITGASTIATSFSSAAVSLAGPFLRQASKQVPGGETLTQTAPSVATLAAQALSLMASRLPHAPSAVDGPMVPDKGAKVSSSDVLASSKPPTYPGAPERDPWSEKPDWRTGKAGKFEDDLAREEQELFDGDKKAPEDIGGVHNK